MKIVDLDLKNKRILAELEQDARQTNKQIAKKVGVNTNLVRYRIQKLEEEELITRFLTFVNFAKIGYTDYGIYLTTQHMTQEVEQEFVKYCLNHKRITYLAKLGGKYDFVIGMLAKDVLEFHELFLALMDSYGQYVADKDIAIRLQLFHFSKTYLLYKKDIVDSMPQFGGRVTTERLDELDEQILSELSCNARINVVALAQKTNTPASTITLRIKKLREKKVIEGFYAMISCQKYGYQNYLVHASLKNLTRQNENKLYSYCKQQPNITYLIKTVGRWDYEISIEVANQEELQKILGELREEFFEQHITLDTSILFKDLKYDLYPF